MVTFPELEAVAALAPEITARSREFESVRRLPADLARELAEAGIFRMAIAKEYGGAERRPAGFSVAADCARDLWVGPAGDNRRCGRAHRKSDSRRRWIPRRRTLEMGQRDAELQLDHWRGGDLRGR